MLRQAVQVKLRFSWDRGKFLQSLGDKVVLFVLDKVSFLLIRGIVRGGTVVGRCTLGIQGNWVILEGWFLVWDVLVFGGGYLGSDGGWVTGGTSLTLEGNTT